MAEKRVKVIMAPPAQPERILINPQNGQPIQDPRFATGSIYDDLRGDKGDERGEQKEEVKEEENKDI